MNRRIFKIFVVLLAFAGGLFVVSAHNNYFYNAGIKATGSDFSTPIFSLYDKVHVADKEFTVIETGSTLKLLSDKESETGKTFAEAETSLASYNTTFGTIGNKIVNNKITLPKTDDLVNVTEPDSTIIADGHKLNDNIPKLANDWWLGDESVDNRSKFIDSDNSYNKEMIVFKSDASSGACLTKSDSEYGLKPTNEEEDPPVGYKNLESFDNVALGSNYATGSYEIRYYHDNSCINEGTWTSGSYADYRTYAARDGIIMADSEEGMLRFITGWYSVEGHPWNYFLQTTSFMTHIVPKQHLNKCLTFKMPMAKYTLDNYVRGGFNKQNPLPESFIYRSAKFTRAADDAQIWKGYYVVGATSLHKPSNITYGDAECKGQLQTAGTSSVRPLLTLNNSDILLSNIAKRSFILSDTKTISSNLPTSDTGITEAYLTLLSDDLTIQLDSSVSGVTNNTLSTTLPSNNILSIPITLGGDVDGTRYVSAIAEIKGVKRYGLLKEMNGTSGSVELDVSNFSNDNDPSSLSEIKLTLYQENSGDYTTSYMGNGTDITIKLGKTQTIEFDSDLSDTLTYGDTITLTSSLTSSFTDQANTDITYSVIDGTDKVSLTQSYDSSTGKATATFTPKTGTGTFTVAIDKAGTTGISVATQKTMTITLHKKNATITAVKPIGTFKVDQAMPSFTVKSNDLVNGDQIPNTLLPSLTPMDASTPSKPHTSGIIDQIGTWKIQFSDTVLDGVDQTFKDKYNITLKDYDDDNSLIFETNPSNNQMPEMVVIAKVDGKEHPSNTWTKGELVFTLGGGLTSTLRSGYEVAITNGSTPQESDWSTINDPSNNQHKVNGNINGKTYWFRAVPALPGTKISKPYIVKLDNEAPTNVQITLTPVKRNVIEQMLDAITFGAWLKDEQIVTFHASDNFTTSSDMKYVYAEEKEGTVGEYKECKGNLTYKETDIILHVKAVDLAGNESDPPVKKTLKIDKEAPTITGVKDKSEYKQYYLPRFVTVTDSGSGLKQATYKKNNTPAGTFTDNVETPIRGQGTYEIYAIDEAGNEITVTFKIVKLPNIETEIDGSDESRDIIDQIIKEYEEVKNKIDPNEKKEYEEWIKEAEEKWDSLRKKVVEHQETTSKVEGQGDTTFDPKIELIVEEIPKENIPVLPRNAIKTYDVYLKKGNTVVQPDGSVKVYLPYDEKETPIVYEINDDGTITELTANQENGYVTFVTTTLKKYAISNTAQKENKKDVCVIGPDGKLGTADDVCGSDDSTKNEDGSVAVPDGGKVIFPDKEVSAPDGAIINPDGSVDFPDGTHFDPDGNESKKPDPKPNPDDGKDEQICVAGPDGKLGTADDVCGSDDSTKNEDGSVTVPDGGKVIFPDKEVDAPDGATINPDGSVDFPDGTHYDPDGNETTKPDPKPNPNPDDNTDKVCAAGPDGKLGTSDDVCGEGNGAKDPEKKPDGSIEIPDGGSVIFPDGSEVELPDGGIIKPDGSVELPDGTIYDKDGNKKDPNDSGKKECKLEGKDINIDTDGDGLPDLNLDINNDCIAELNIDTNFDNIPDINIDSTGNGKENINVDTNNDGKADLNLAIIKQWIPNKNDCVYNGFKYDTMTNIEPYLNIDDNGDGTPDRNIDDDGDGTPDRNIDSDWFDKYGSKGTTKTDSTVQGTHANSSQLNKNTGGVSTGDQTKWVLWWILLIGTGSMIYYSYKKKKE